MKRSRFTEEQILREQEAGVAVTEPRRKRAGGLDVSEAQRLKTLDYGDGADGARERHLCAMMIVVAGHHRRRAIHTITVTLSVLC